MCGEYLMKSSVCFGIYYVAICRRKNAYIFNKLFFIIWVFFFHFQRDESDDEASGRKKKAKLDAMRTNMMAMYQSLIDCKV